METLHDTKRYNYISQTIKILPLLYMLYILKIKQYKANGLCKEKKKCVCNTLQILKSLNVCRACIQKYVSYQLKIRKYLIVFFRSNRCKK